MRIVRKTVFWLHLGIGLLAGAVILVMAVTGFLMAYERQLTEWADGFHLTPCTQAASLEKLLENRTPASVMIVSDPTQPVALQFDKTKTEFIDPNSGQSAGAGNRTVRDFFRTMLKLHRTLGQEGASQPVGKAIIGAGNLMFLFLVVSGLFLWCPRRWSLSALRLITLFQHRLKGRGRDWNWHNVFGFWACIPLFVIIVSGTVIAYPWANALVFRLAGEIPPPQKDGKPKKSDEPRNLTGVDSALTAVKAASPGWQSILLTIPTGKTATFAVANSHRGRPDLRRQITVDLASSKILKNEGMESQSTGRQARTWLRWIHTGEAGGLAGQTIAGLATAAAAVLVWTGFSLAWRRFFKKRTA